MIKAYGSQRLATHERNGWTVQPSARRVSNMKAWKDKQLAAGHNVNCISSGASKSAGYGYKLACKRPECRVKRASSCKNGAFR